ncbi:uncharacterized protein M6B38_409010 [Iris pallida]|uniref:Uncharacterized protein n=1 Tax=Iris pallida TaxID=29817 RepID=A0AAX6FMV9_IRIPA|nr:uncharacterized protein M6B38_409010 [Iris pallida]
MGNCQVAEAATVVIQHPGGRTERLYWPTTAEEVIKCYPGHHVALIIQENQDCAIRAPCCARVRLLKPNHMLLTGQVYRLITDQEATRVLEARKHKLRRRQHELIKKQQEIELTRADESNELREERDQETSQDRRQHKSARSARQWQPALGSIEEDGLLSE